MNDILLKKIKKLIKDVCILKRQKGYEPAYKVYTALLSQSGAGVNPVVNVLENTLGEPIIVGADGPPGIYSFISPTSLFTVGKTTISFGNARSSNSDYIFPTVESVYLQDPSSIKFNTFNENGFLSDDLLDGTMVEIRVYN